MKKTSIYLEPSLDEALAKRAAHEGVTKAEFIRRTLWGAVHAAQAREAVDRGLQLEAMSVVLDTSAIVAAYDRRRSRPRGGRPSCCARSTTSSSPRRSSPRRWTARSPARRAARRCGRTSTAGPITVRWWADAMDETLRIARRHPVLGLADASLVALAGRLRTDRIATFDEHFRSVTLPRGSRSSCCLTQTLGRT